MSQFESDTASDVGQPTLAPLNNAGNRPPRIWFEVDPEHKTRMTASPPGALITCLCCTDGSDASVVRVETSDHKHIADVTVHATGPDDLTTETIAIASAIYWSWWRVEDMYGRTHAEVPR